MIAAGIAGRALGDWLRDILASEESDHLLEESPGYTEGQLRQFEKQMEEEGRESLEQSRRSFEERIAEHRQKIEEAQASGGYTSSMEREIRNFEGQISAIDEVLGRTP